MKKIKRIYGFSLLELLIVISIMAVIGVIGSGFYSNYGRGIDINSFSQTISFDLKQAQSKAMIGVDNLKWGVHFVNGDTSDYYEIFSTPTDYTDGTKVVFSQTYLPSSVTFSDPVANSTKDIIFNKISGGTTASFVTIISSNITKMISVSSIGNISVQ